MDARTIIEIAIALIFVIFLLSLFASSVQTIYSKATDMRAGNLRHGLRKLLADRAYGDEVFRRFYRHPLIAPEVSGGPPRKLSRDAFLTALSYAIRPAGQTGGARETISGSVAALEDGDLKDRLQAIVPDAYSNPTEAEVAVDAWFSSIMRQIDQRYTSMAHKRLIVISVATVLAFNISIVEIAEYLVGDARVRGAVNTLATSYVSDPRFQAQFAGPDPSAPGGEDLAGLIASGGGPADYDGIADCLRGGLNLPIGWPGLELPFIDTVSEEARIQSAARCAALAGDDPQVQLVLASNAAANERQYGPTFETDGVVVTVLGWLLTVIAMSQGAPFWFNLLRYFTGRGGGQTAPSPSRTTTRTI